MATWEDLLKEFGSLASAQEKNHFLNTKLNEALIKIASRRNSNVLVYASGFLQKPSTPPNLLQISPEDINGFMASINGMNFEQPLTLILHTPGGVMTATETIVEYLRSKFSGIEVIVPVYAMSGGTMIAMAADRIIMGRQSQLGPIDSQFSMPQGGSMSATSILAQFERAKKEIAQDKTAAAAWAPILATIGPSLIQSAQNALDCGQQMVEKWLTAYLFSNLDNPEAKAKGVASYFNDEDVHLNHGRRIGAGEADEIGLNIELLEDNQNFQEDVLTAYHLLTIIFEQTPAAKIMRNNLGRGWVKNIQQQVVQR